MLSQALKPTMLLVFLGVLIFFGVVSVVLNYHWKEYGIDSQRLSKVRRIYFGVSAILLVAITIFILPLFL